MKYEKEWYNQLIKVLSYLVVSIIFPIGILIILCHLDPYSGETLFEGDKV